jgi:hypothetical protein
MFCKILGILMLNIQSANTIKTNRDYLIEAEVVETNCRLLLGMISSCGTIEIDILRWIVNIKSLSLEIRHNRCYAFSSKV